MELRKKATIVGLVTATLLLTIGLSQFMQYVPKSFIVYAAGTPDAYGNHIYLVSVREGTTTLINIYATNYTLDATYEVDANIELHFFIRVYINKTLCNNDESLADDYTRVYVNVTGHYVNELIPSYIIDPTGTDGDYFWASYSGIYWTTTADTTYQIGVRYEAYY